MTAPRIRAALVAIARTALDAARPRRAPARRSAFRSSPSPPGGDLQQRRDPRSQGRRRRPRPLRDLAALRPGDRLRAGRQRGASAPTTSTAPCTPSGPARRSPPSTSRANFERDLLGRPPAADRRLLQQAILHPRQHRVRRASARRRRRRPPSCRPSAARARLRAGPLVVEQYVLTNPALNYAQFLLRAVLPTVLHVVIADRRRLCCRLRVRPRAACAPGCAAAGGSPLTGARRQARALFRHLPRS